MGFLKLIKGISCGIYFGICIVAINYPGLWEAILMRSYTPGKKKSGRICGPSQMSAFNSTLTECGSSNIGFEGFRYTWTNNRRVPGTVRCRLDRVCVNEEAIYLSLTTMVSHIEQPSLDHIPIFFRLARPDKPAPLSRGRPFRFEAMWIHKDDCEEIIHKVWRTLEDLIRLL